MKAEKLIKSTVVKFVVFGSLAVLLATIVSAINNSFSETFLVDMQRTVEMVRIGNDDVLTFDDLKDLKDKTEYDSISGYSEKVAAISNKSGYCIDGAKVVLFNEDYSLIYKVKLLTGSFPDEEMVKIGKAYAVISDRLAIKLFMSVDIIGNELEIMDRKFIVSGVYKSRKPILWSLCGDGYDRVYIPYTSYNNFAELPVDIVTILKKQDQHITEIKTKLNTVIENKISSYEIIDHLESSIAYQQYFNLLLFIIGLFSILLFVIFTIKYTVNTIRLIVNKSDSYYFIDLLGANSKRIKCNILLFLICYAVATFIIKATEFRFFIADKFIPDDNIFDIKVYIEAIIKNKMLLNSHETNIYSIFNYVCINILQIEVFCTVLILIFLIVSHLFCKILFQLGAKSKNLLCTSLLITIIGGTSGEIIAVLMGFDVFVPIKVWTIFLIYLIALQINNLTLIKVYSKNEVDTHVN